MALSEQDEAVAKLKQRVQNLDSLGSLGEIREHQRAAILLEARECLARCVDSITRGHVPAYAFATRLLNVAESLGTIL